MTWFADLEPCTYFDQADEEDTPSFGLIAVGWLEPEHDHARGVIDDIVRAQLRTLLRNIWSPFQYLGGHPCRFCLDWRRMHAEPPAIPGHPNSFLNLLVPGKGRVYASPELIGHYISTHEYRPPDEFCEAVLACPPIWSDAYFDALRSSGTAPLRAMMEDASEIMEEMREAMVNRELPDWM